MKTEAGYSKNTIRNMRNLISGVMALSIEDKIVESSWRLHGRLFGKGN